MEIPLLDKRMVDLYMLAPSLRHRAHPPERAAVGVEEMLVPAIGQVAWEKSGGTFPCFLAGHDHPREIQKGVSLSFHQSGRGHRAVAIVEKVCG